MYILKAIIEYGKCLAARERYCSVGDRLLSEAHYNLAVAHIYQSGEEGADSIAEKRSALKHYRAAKECLLASSPVVPSTSDIAAAAVAVDQESIDRKELATELNETIIALNADIQASMRAMLQAPSSTSNSGFGYGTSIGFGQAASASSITSSANSVSSSNVASVAIATPNVTVKSPVKAVVVKSPVKAVVVKSPVKAVVVKSPVKAVVVKSPVKLTSISAQDDSEPARKKSKIVEDTDGGSDSVTSESKM
jgi:hypothetical protein